MKINNFNRWLFYCLLFIAAMILVRIKYSGSIRFIFLIWNLFLAYVPFLLSVFFQQVSKKAKWKQSLLFIAWLLFFPNALYIVTDIIHLEEMSGVPIWFDAVLLFTSSFAGLALAFASLMNVEFFLQKYFSTNSVTILVKLLLFAGAFGVYLGRFKRWNSWNVIIEPITLAADIAGRFINPFSHLRSWLIIFFLTILYAICWYFLKSISSINRVGVNISK